MSATPKRIPKRRSVRYKPYRSLVITCEGRPTRVTVHEPDLSIHGMFINTSEHFAEGTVVLVNFVLTKSGYEVNVRSEVRYCLPGVGIGVEFLDISPEAQRAIAEEFSHLNGNSPVPKPGPFCT